MANGNRLNPPSETTPKMISVDPDEGFGPHISDDFLACYGEESVFVTAVVNCLNYRFNRVLVRAGKIAADHQPVQYGEPVMREAIELLVRTLGNQNVENPPALLLRSATGYAEPQAFLVAAGALLGADLIANWLRHLEHEDYAAAAALLAIH